MRKFFSQHVFIFLITTFFLSCNTVAEKGKMDSVSSESHDVQDGNPKLKSDSDSLAAQAVKPKLKTDSTQIFISPPLKKTSGDLKWTAMSSFHALELDGCGCQFSKNEEDFKSRKFLCVMDFDTLAVLLINNEITQLQLIKTNKPKDSFPSDTLRSIYSN